jgi:dienelactone hydrolase
MLSALACAAGVAGCAATTELAMTTSTPAGGIEQIPVRIAKPEGPGPFPAVVIMHDCSGLGMTSSGAPARWANVLVDRGYAVIIPDSFATRGWPQGVCTDASPRRNDVGPLRRMRDAYAALAFARSLPYVDDRRIGLMGGSHGGTTTLAAMVAPERDSDLLAAEKRAGFAAAIALYPRCAVRLGNWRADLSGTYRPVAPLLILIGEKDDWTPAEDCRRLAQSAQTAGHPVSIKIYPGAHHSFDSNYPVRYVPTRVNASAPSGRGATTGGDPSAWADSIQQAAEFFARHLK